MPSISQPDFTKSYWMDVAPLVGAVASDVPRSGGVLIVGSGLAGVSTAYWLLQQGFEDLTIVDYEMEKSASFRNCGHILYGTVESMKALSEIHGEKLAKEVWSYSIDLCHEVRDTIARLSLDVDYKQDGYLVIAIDEVENQEIQESVALLNRNGFGSEYVSVRELKTLGFKNITGARYEPGSAQAHPVKFRNGLLQHVVAKGVKYHSGVAVQSLNDSGEGVAITTNQGVLNYDAAVIAANAYSPLFSDFFSSRRLVEPFRGQIITSKPLREHQFKVTFPHSFDHGYEYALVTPDQRLMIGGWRNQVPGRELGTYDVMPNPMVDKGLQDFVRDHYEIRETIEWEYSWAGIMAASKTGFYMIGPTNSPRIFACAGCTGHGFSWAHGASKLLADIMAGNSLPSVARLFNPNQI